MQILNQRNQTRQVDGLEQLRGAIEDFNDFYVDMCIILLEEGDGRKLVAQRYQNFQACSSILCDVQRYAEPSSFDSMPRWLSKVVEFASTRNTHTQRILLTSAEILLDLLEKKKNHFAGDGDDNIRKIQFLILPTAMEAQSPGGHDETNYCMEIIQNLWSLLGESGDHVGIVSLLKRFDLLLPRLFSDVVTQELNSRDREVKFFAVEKFNIFWKLTANDYHVYKPFQPEYERIRQSNTLANAARAGDFVTNI